MLILHAQWDAAGAFRGAEMAQCVPLAVHVAPFAVTTLTYRSGALAYGGQYSEQASCAAVLWTCDRGRKALVPATEATNDAGVVEDDGKKSLRRSKPSKKSKSKRGGMISEPVSAEVNLLALTHDNSTQRVAATFEEESWAVWTESGSPVVSVCVCARVVVEEI